jgi:hypothetical protein
VVVVCVCAKFYQCLCVNGVMRVGDASQSCAWALYARAPISHAVCARGDMHSTPNTSLMPWLYRLCACFELSECGQVVSALSRFRASVCVCV